MAVRILIPGALRAYAGHAKSVEVDAGNVGAALDALFAVAPGMRAHLLTDGGELRAFVRLYRNEDDVLADGGLGARLRDGDTLSIVPAIAGGADVDADKLAAARAAM